MGKILLGAGAISFAGYLIWLIISVRNWDSKIPPIIGMLLSAVMILGGLDALDLNMPDLDALWDGSIIGRVFQKGSDPMESQTGQISKGAGALSFAAWPQPDESELKSFLREKLDDLNTNILVVDDSLRELLAASSYDSVQSEEAYAEWKNRFLEWSYGAVNFDFSLYSKNADSMADILPSCGEYMGKFPDAYIASYYGISETAREDLENLNAAIEGRFGELIDIVYMDTSGG